MTITEWAAQVRGTLRRQHGWTSRQVSVRTRYCSMGSAIDVTITDPAIPLPTVARIARAAEDISRDEQGEILSGGNTYVHVYYSHEAQRVHGRRYADAVQRAVDATPVGSSCLTPVEATGYLVGRPTAERVTLWDDGGYITERWGVDGLADVIGANMVARMQATTRTVMLPDES